MGKYVNKMYMKGQYGETALDGLLAILLTSFNSCCCRPCGVRKVVIHSSQVLGVDVALVVVVVVVVVATAPSLTQVAFSPG
jgi:hypothetical protein